MGAAPHFLCGTMDTSVLETLESPDNKSVTTIAFALDGLQLASGSFNGAVKLWDVRSRRLLQTLGAHEHPVGLVAFSDDDHLTSSSHDDKFELPDPASTVISWVLQKYQHTITTLAFSPDGKPEARGLYDRNFSSLGVQSPE